MPTPTPSGNSNGFSSSPISGKGFCFLIFPSLINRLFLWQFSPATHWRSSLGSCGTSFPRTASSRISSRSFLMPWGLWPFPLFPRPLPPLAFWVLGGGPDIHMFGDQIHHDNARAPLFTYSCERRNPVARIQFLDSASFRQKTGGHARNDESVIFHLTNASFTSHFRH